MTRENKLALVLGFGLMLFVGILVSDHLAARQAPPVATSLASRRDVGVPPLPPPGGENEGIVLTGGDGSVRQVPPGELPQQEVPQTPDQEALATKTAPPVAPPVAPSTAEKTYTIREGDTFAAIAKAEYGKRSLGEQLAKFNGLNPSKLKVGASIKLPAITTLDPTATASAEPTTPATPASKYRMYKVREGDNLYRIAERELGAGNRWQELQTCNDELLKGSDQLTPGTQIKIPVEGRNSNA